MTEATTSRIARITGLAYLGIIFSGIFGEFLVRMALVEPGDAATTTINIAGAESWFRAALAADLLMIALDIGVAVGLYVLLRPCTRRSHAWLRPCDSSRRQCSGPT